MIVLRGIRGLPVLLDPLWMHEASTTSWTRWTMRTISRACQVLSVLPSKLGALVSVGSCVGVVLVVAGASYPRPMGGRAGFHVLSIKGCIPLVTGSSPTKVKSGDRLKRLSLAAEGSNRDIHRS